MHNYKISQYWVLCRVGETNKILDKVQIGSPLKGQRPNQNMHYVDLKTLPHQRFLVTFENRNWTTLIMITYYGMDLIWPVPRMNATSK
jgi:hypothetical protein